ncbi:hypothetical protein CDAR_418061 [Caerostris darwini]|uniref:Uncharacterized protein n=1 Tax=Caerostris darwini TaxID=1538125 RepID=A0AAV4RTJ3_9ARAC|nr:hypothetical protein CDAR_418061 [Caerostris darwini]
MIYLIQKDRLVHPSYHSRQTPTNDHVVPTVKKMDRRKDCASFKNYRCDQKDDNMLGFLASGSPKAVYYRQPAAAYHDAPMSNRTIMHR